MRVKQISIKNNKAKVKYSKIKFFFQAAIQHPFGIQQWENVVKMICRNYIRLGNSESF